MTLKIIVLVAFTITLTGCVSNRESTQLASNKTTETKPSDDLKQVATDPKDNIICKYRTPTGSKITKRQCMKKKSWDSISEASQNARNKINKPAYNSINSD